MTTTSKNIYLSGLIAFIVMIVINFALWRLFFAPTNGVFKLFTPMYGLSLVGLAFYTVMLMSDVFGYDNDSGNMGTALILLISSIVIFYLIYYLFFWNFLGKFGIAYFSPQAQVAAGGTGMEMWNARENSSLAILYIVTALIWVSAIWNAGFGNAPWDDLSQRVIGTSKFFAIAFLSIIVYSLLFHPNVTALFVPKQIYAGVLPWWEGPAMTSSSFYHLGWMFGGLFLIMFLHDCAEGFPFNLISTKKSGSIWGLLVALIITVAGGFLFLYIAEAIMTYFWYEPFTGGNYTDDPRFRHLHVAEIAAFFMLAMVIVKVFFNNIIQGSSKLLNTIVRFIIIPCAGMLIYWFYYCEILGPKFVDRVPGVGSIEDTSLCWTIMSITLIMIYDKFFNAFPLRK